VTYLLDANVFIQAKNLHYGLDFCPAFWSWLIEKNEAALVYTIDKVADEIAAGDDELSDWMSGRDDSFALRTDAVVARQFGKVSTWVMEENYEPAATSTFMQVADYYLVCHALAGNHTVVTHEIASSSTKKVKVPNACAGLDLRFMTPYEMLRREHARFVLGGAQ